MEILRLVPVSPVFIVSVVTAMVALLGVSTASSTRTMVEQHPRLCVILGGGGGMTVRTRSGLGLHVWHKTVLFQTAGNGGVSIKIELINKNRMSAFVDLFSLKAF